MHGKIWHGERKGEPVWFIEAAPYVATRLKKILPKVNRYQRGTITVVDTAEMAFELEWILSRWPMHVDPADSELLAGKAARYRESRDTVSRILQGYIPPSEWREPLLIPRDYQLVAAALAHETGSLLLADALGLGKSFSSLLLLRDPDALPALVVAQTHLVYQWEREVRKAFPWLTPHVIETGKVYDPLGSVRQLPLGESTGNAVDVLIVNYHKLAKWSEYLAGTVHTVIFDEAQELRRRGTGKYEAATRVAREARWRCGLSVGPDGFVELVGGPFGSGWVGSVETAFSTISECADLERDHGYELLRVSGLGIRSRGWQDGSFAWKNVCTFVRHVCDTEVVSLRSSGSALVLTDEHSVYRVTPYGLDLSRADAIAIGDRLALDNGNAWDGLCREPLYDMIELAGRRPCGQVVVDLSGVDHHDLEMELWQWHNSIRECMHGTRVPVATYQKFSDKLPPPKAVYLSSGRGGRRVPPFVRLSDWAYLLGFYLGDGWVQGTRIAFAVENSMVPSFLKMLESIQDVDIEPKISKRAGASVEIRFGNPLMADLIRDVTGRAKCQDKAIPGEWIISWSEVARRELLKGLLESDGHIGEKGRRHYVTTSKKLAESLLSLLRSLGVAGSLQTSNPHGAGGVVDGRQIVGRRTRYAVAWSRHAEEGDNSGHRGNRSRYGWTRGKLKEVAVHSSTPQVAPHHVYDIEMEGHPSFVVGGVLVHNTATPVYNFGDEIHSVVSVLDSEVLGSEEEFKREWCTYGYGKPKVSDPAALGAYLRDQGVMLRRTREEVGRELPDVIRVTHTIDLDSAKLDALTSDAAVLAKTILEATGSPTELFRASGEFDWRLRHATGVAKAPYVAEFTRLLLESGEAVVLFAWHRSCYDILLERLDEFKPAMYTGSETGKHKERNAQAFLDGDTDLLIMSLRAGAGLDGLQERSKVAVFGELDWSPGVHAQGIGRLNRDGQTEPVLAYFLVADSGSDPAVAEVLNLKRQQSDPIIDPNLEQVVAVDQTDRVKLLARQFLNQKGPQ